MRKQIQAPLLLIGCMILYTASTSCSDYTEKHALVTLAAAYQMQLMHEGVDELIDHGKPTKLAWSIAGFIATFMYNRSQEERASLNQAALFGIYAGNVIYIAPGLYQLSRTAYRMLMQQQE